MIVASRPYRVPPAPHVFQGLREEFRRLGLAGRMKFADYLVAIGFTDPSAELNGMDDGFSVRAGPGGPQLFSIPQQRIIGDLDVQVLLVDFADRPGTRPQAEFENLLFSDGGHPTGSMRDYFGEVSRQQVVVRGTVSHWLRMPQPYSYYTDGSSGTGKYPHNAQRLAEDAVQAAVAEGLAFPAALDKLDQGLVTALIIVHAGVGAEVMPKALQGAHIWSHKWVLRKPVSVGPNLIAGTYLTIPEDCKLGVCAHELGHLAFQWEDFYDANYDEDGDYWDGTGDWDLMASGSYNGNGGDTPAHPAGVHVAQHGWVPTTVITAAGGSVQQITLPAPLTPGEHVVKIRSTAFQGDQCLLLENRRLQGFDAKLPGGGLLVWRVDESEINTSSMNPGIALVGASGKQVLLDPGDYNQGDPGDPFPGSAEVTSLPATGLVSTSFPGGAPSRVSLSGIAVKASGDITLAVTFG